MNHHSATIEKNLFSPIPLRRSIGVALFILFFQIIAFPQTPSISTSEDETTLIVEDAGGSEVLSFGKNVVVKKHAKGVFAFGGDIVVEGAVDGDVATIGGSVLQKEGAFIGGDVIILGGTYRSESSAPRRDAAKETVIIGIFEEELRDFAQNPTAVFSPALTWSFLAQRIVSVLFWFVLSFALTTISPGAVSRAVARFQLSALKILGFGLAGFLVTTVGVILGVTFLPGYLSGVISLMALILLALAYIFGRVALQVSLGKMIQKQFLPESRHSETLAILLGVVAWTVILSFPYLWTFALVMLFSASVGLVLTARNGNGWQKA